MSFQVFSPSLQVILYSVWPPNVGCHNFVTRNFPAQRDRSQVKWSEILAKMAEITTNSANVKTIVLRPVIRGDIAMLPIPIHHYSMVQAALHKYGVDLERKAKHYMQKKSENCITVRPRMRVRLEAGDPVSDDNGSDNVTISTSQS